ncbi:MAG: ABC transporter ATP-binding protein [Candidatus Manganitrophaceae bacterium]|nr:MAG: ABC transporter ATP-binding protein [Candidatus Manganitrophaceae bacterium]
MSPGMATVIELVEMTKTYPGGKMPAVYEVSFKINKGQVLALLGPSGSGKTTLLRLIAGFETPDQGKIFLNGQEVSHPHYCLPPEKRGVGMVFQDYALFPHLTVEGNVSFGLGALPRDLRRKRVGEVIEQVGLTPLIHRYPHELSGGQQQRVALARALAPNPIVLMLDEPFSNLDPDMRTQMRMEVAAILRRTGSTAILVTHDHEEAFAMADKVAVLNAGRLEQCDPPELVYHIPATPFIADFVGQADFIPGVIRDGKVVAEIGIFPNASPFIDGTEVMVMIRPDDIDLVPHEKGAATVLGRQFKGSENLYTIALPSGQILHSSQHSLAVYSDQTKVDLKLKVTHTVLFRRDDAFFERGATHSEGGWKNE